MGYDIEELKFIGMIHSVSESEFGVSVSDDEGELFVKSVYKEYQEENKPKNKRQWIKDKLKASFLSVAQLPVWIGSSAAWPFYQGKPMVFIQQLEVPETEISAALVSPKCVLYVFGAKKIIPEIANGWEMVYHVVEQQAGL